jgi:sec-independent protein translocase protein TatA
MDVGAPELLIISAVTLLIFGPTKLPGLARSLGTASREFRKGLGHDDTANDDTANDDAVAEKEW